MLVVNAGVFFSKNLHKNGVYFPEERNAFVLDHQHGRRDVTCIPAIEKGKGKEEDKEQKIFRGHFASKSCPNNSVRESRFRNQGNFCLWNLEYRSRNPNPTNDWNPESESHFQRIRNPVARVRNPWSGILSRIHPLHVAMNTGVIK